MCICRLNRVGTSLWANENKRGFLCTADSSECNESCGNLGKGVCGKEGHGEGMGDLEGQCSGELGMRLAFPICRNGFPTTPYHSSTPSPPTKQVCCKGFYVSPFTAILCYNTTGTKVTNITITQYDPESK